MEFANALVQMPGGSPGSTSRNDKFIRIDFVSPDTSSAAVAFISQARCHITGLRLGNFFPIPQKCVNLGEGSSLGAFF